MRCLGEVVEGTVSLSPLGEVVAEKWQEIPRQNPWIVLDEWIVMPDHMHGILIFNNPTPQDGSQGSKYLHSQSLGAVIGQFKSEVTKRIWWTLNRRDFAWQTRFWDDILHTPADLEKVRSYIQQNPKNWQP